MTLKSNPLYWLISNDEAAVTWRATAPTPELAANLLALNYARSKSMTDRFFVANEGGGYVVNETIVDVATLSEMGLWRLAQIVVEAFGGVMGDLGLVAPEPGNAPAAGDDTDWEAVSNAVTARVTARPQQRSIDTGERVQRNAADYIEAPMPSKAAVQEHRAGIAANMQAAARGLLLVEDGAAMAPTTNADEQLIEAPMPQRGE